MENLLFEEEIDSRSGNFICTTKPVEFEQTLIKQNNNSCQISCSSMKISYSTVKKKKK